MTWWYKITALAYLLYSDCKLKVSQTIKPILLLISFLYLVWVLGFVISYGIIICLLLTTHSHKKSCKDAIKSKTRDGFRHKTFLFLTWKTGGCRYNLQYVDPSKNKLWTNTTKFLFYLGELLFYFYFLSRTIDQTASDQNSIEYDTWKNMMCVCVFVSV